MELRNASARGSACSHIMLSALPRLIPEQCAIAWRSRHMPSNAALALPLEATHLSVLQIVTLFPYTTLFRSHINHPFHRLRMAVNRFRIIFNALVMAITDIVSDGRARRRTDRKSTRLNSSHG